MNIDFLSNSPKNSTIVDGSTGQVLFEVSTPTFMIGKRTTTLKNARGQTIGEYEYRGFGHNRVIFHGDQRRVSEWLPTKSVFSTSRRLTTANGKEYLWKSRKSNGTFKLVDLATDQTMAETRHANMGIIHSKRHMGIDLSPELIPSLDAVLLSFIICEQERRERAEAAEGGDGADGGGGGC